MESQKNFSANLDLALNGSLESEKENLSDSLSKRQATAVSLVPGQKLIKEFRVTDACTPVLPTKLAGPAEDLTWGPTCNMGGPTFREVVGAAGQGNLLWILIPILAITLLLLLGACAVCVLMRQKKSSTAPRSTPPPSGQTVLAQPHNVSKTQVIQEPTQRTSLATSQGVAPFGNVVASNVPYVVQGQTVRNVTRSSSGVIPEDVEGGGGGREGSILDLERSRSPEPGARSRAILAGAERSPEQAKFLAAPGSKPQIKFEKFGENPQTYVTVWLAPVNKTTSLQGSQVLKP
ncbi:unnamed protein product [Notodromas monacha]|uniref:Uncharacterized protein n=1 Tax=Notodromas monacha TaxID=399045 RepID=A0A7R9BTQ5_9CRUS|nr:unnamed protein product [Notodromas monacha]CAG0920182.1 unnamed protein product [Notodromas monacha]